MSKVKNVLGKVGNWAKDNKAGIVGLTGLLIAEMAFLLQGNKDGYQRGFMDGANGMLGFVEEEEPGMVDRIGEKLDKIKEESTEE